MAANYKAVGSNASPYGSGDPYYNESSGFVTPHRAKKRTSNWIKIGVPVLILVIVGAVVGGVLGSRAAKKSTTAGGSSGGSSGGAAAASSAASVKLEVGRFATATNSAFMVPVYPSTTNTAAFTTPTFNQGGANNALAWPKDPFQPSKPNVLETRPDRPRLIAPGYKWAALPALIKNEPYLKGWNDTIIKNATDYYSLPPVKYHLDGDSGLLDNAREVKMRIKAFAYTFLMTNDTKWIDRTWAELQNAAGTGPTPFGNDTDRWNSVHFLDVAEFTAAFAIGYDWLHSQWNEDQKGQIRSAMIKYGLQPGLAASTDSNVGWWTSVNGNWNCVCNSGLTLGSLAILDEDDTGIAKQLLALTVPNAAKNCAFGPSDDGTWSETANYWYFGTTAHAEMSSALLTATGSHYGLLDANPGLNKTGQFHMYVSGATSLFNYGDHGPGKFSTTANSMMLYADTYNQPQYALFQREQFDAAEPWSMFWYNPTVSGAFWDGTPLDMFFDNGLDQWASMRSSWTDSNALYVAVKAGMNQGHQTHNDLDAGDFVLDALGTRWAGELGSGDYLSPNYFLSDKQDADRWKYYRKMTEGQNTILVNGQNQNVAAAPTVKHDTSGTTQGSSTVLELTQNSTAWWSSDLTSAYFGATVKRGVRLLNARKQVLIQDEITSTDPIQWRMHTNATITFDEAAPTATLALDGQTMKVAMVQPPAGAKFTQGKAQRAQSDVVPPAPDQENPGVSVLIVSLPAGTYTLQVLFNPQWSGMSDSAFVTPKTVALNDWSLQSHD